MSAIGRMLSAALKVGAGDFELNVENSPAQLAPGGACPGLGHDDPSGTPDYRRKDFQSD